MSQKIIDPHVHFFDLKKGDYSWLKTLNPQHHNKISHSFSVHDLALPEAFELVALVHVEAGFDNKQPWREIAYIDDALSQAAIASQKQGQLQWKTSGMLNLAAPPFEFVESVDKQVAFDSCVALRQIVDSQLYEKDFYDKCGQGATLFQSSQVLGNLQYLASKNLALELQMDFCDTQAVHDLLYLLVQVSSLKVIVNHCGLPPILSTSKQVKSAQSPLQAWKDNIKQIAGLKNVFIKCSGWEMRNEQYLEPKHKNSVIEVLQYIADCFGEKRMMLASNFPLVLYVSDYAAYWQSMIESLVICQLSVDKLCYQNAKQIYRFER